MERMLTCECGEKIVVSRAQAGQDVECGSCGAKNQVPTLRGLSSLPLANAGSNLKSSPAEADTWSWRGPVTAICLAGLIVSCLYSSYKFYVWTQINTDTTAEVHIAHDLAELDQTEVDSLLLLWDDYSKVSLGSKRPPIYKQINDFSAQSLKSAFFGSTIAAVLFSIGFVTLLSARSARKKLSK